MKQLQHTFFAALCLIFILSSCSVQKRHYTGGYYVTWKKGKHKADANSVAATTKTQPATFETVPVQVINETSAVNEAALTASSEKNAAPVILKTTKPVIMHTSASAQKAAAAKQVKKENKQLLKKERKKSSAGAGGKSQVVALLLCIFLGVLGIHRFYLGYTGMGILYLFTAGLFGIGWIIDIILLIIPNGLTPKGKTSYDE